MLMATENLGHSAQAFAILGVSIRANVILYLVIAVILWSFIWIIAAATDRAGSSRRQ